MSNIDTVVFNPKDTGAINYVKARYAIESEDSGLRNRKEKRMAKLTVIEHLGGHIDHVKVKGRVHTVVMFNDNTKANF